MSLHSRQIRKTVHLLDYFTNRKVPDGDLICLLGQSITGARVWMDLAQNPHMIIAGTTGSGKSVLMHNIIANLFNYNNTIIHLIDPKNVEFHHYDKSFPNVKVHYSYAEAVNVLDMMIELMDNRYELARNGSAMKDMPYVVLMIDEFADLIMQDKGNMFYNRLLRLAQKCRAARISIVLATQRPSAQIIKGEIKANFPARIACRVANKIDSRIILDATGAEALENGGDALLRDNTRQMERFQVAYVTSEQVCGVFKNLVPIPIHD